MMLRAVGKTPAFVLVVLGCAAGTACSHARTGDASPPLGVVDAGPSSTDAAPTEPPSVFANAKAPEPIPEEPPTCEDGKNVFLFVTPALPSAGVPVRVMAVSDKPLTGKLEIVSAQDGGSTPLAASETRRGGPPYFWTAEIEAPKVGKLDANLVQKACEAGKNVATRRITVGAFKPGPPAAPKEEQGLWPVHRNWNRSLENVYSAWIEQLFDAPDGEMPSWPALHEVLRDKKRNFLFDHLSAGEDSNNAFTARPDCADLPYFLRAYFAFKLRLPFGLSECDRGGGGNPPSCRKIIITNEDPPARFDEKATAVKAFGTFLRGTVADKAHSGSARQPFEEENSDYYPVPLTSDSLRPGTIYADPYGHVLMISKRIAQTSERGGVLLAVDGQPDGTVARKRYWRGNFLYATQRELGGPGFKRFRPVVRRDGKLARLGDAAIARHPDYGDVSRDAQKLDVEGFYDAMDDVLSPRPLDPQKAMMETLAALEEQVKTRVKSVDNGRKWLETAKGPASMPEGPEIFETSGAWEDFSTPSRDLRLLIAIDVVRGFPARVARRPERYAMPPGATPKQVEAELEKILKKELESRTVTYPRTDGSSFTLTLAEVIARGPSLEMAYNPNDCAEARWGAPPGSPEASTCRGQAPAEQRAKMESYRTWFHERRRPPRK
ncbi:MAG: hypothetical protein JST00_32085 [Deltaproteobacteria bacterium]|nr:hypothetical protein [Deltaproteobacteria bacterium]